MVLFNSMLKVWIVCAMLVISAYATNHDEAISLLDEGLMKTNEIINRMMIKWQITEFPNFLKSGAMPKSSWDILKVKFQGKILDGLLSPKGETKFIMTFTGSSVTAGHDSFFNQSFSELTGQVMNEALSIFNIEAVSRNVALGNNPCLPYDVCVKTFAGKDSDLVHWEQSFNCDARDPRFKFVYEQFIRQVLSFQNNAIVVFSNSATPNWDKDKCKSPKPKPAISTDDKHLLEKLTSDPIQIPTELNKREITNVWSGISGMLNKYKAAGMQFFSHEHYDKYKCHGPYVAEWQCCSASWHPSILGHQIRADHHAFYWLLILRDAIQFIQTSLKNSETLDDLSKKMKKHLKAEMKYAIAEPMHESKYSDGLQCYTTFQPHTDESMSLDKLVLPNNDNTPGFKMDIFEMLTEPGVVKKARKMGYKDFKHMLYGNKDSGVLSLKTIVTAKGNSFLCQPPGNWGKLPKGFTNMWECGTEVYLTPNVPVGDMQSFVFQKDKATRISYTQKALTDSQSWLCVDFDSPLPIGSHVLTVVPTTDQKIGFAYLLIP
mmetsp:Transcript_36477/g.67952  ORF Transcript_36477/g.67952 Transcript_36477/m.67952 type:complete len:546 (-) Transcript_36477:123-1760(-)